MRVRTRLAALDSDIVQAAEYGRAIDGTARVHVSKVGGGTTPKAYDGAWEYALLVRMVTGWKVVASGSDVVTFTFKTHAQVADMIAEEYGDGIAEVSRDECCVARAEGDACIRRGDGVIAYCGALVRRPAVFGTSERGHVSQHCIPCNREYRAQHWGKCPITY